MKNDKGITLVPGSWYLVGVAVMNNPDLRKRVMLYTSDTDDAYYNSHMFSNDCNILVLNAMEILP